MSNGEHVCESNPGAIHPVNLQLTLHQDADCLKRLFKHHTQQQGTVDKLNLVCTARALLQDPRPCPHPRVVVGLKITLETNLWAHL